MQFNAIVKQLPGVVSRAYASILGEIFSKKSVEICANDIKNAVANYDPIFHGIAQEDAQEFLGTFLDGLHTELNSIQREPRPSVINIPVGKTEHEVAEIYWNEYKKRNDSIIVNLFRRQIQWKLNVKIVLKNTVLSININIYH